MDWEPSCVKDPNSVNYQVLKLREDSLCKVTRLL